MSFWKKLFGGGSNPQPSTTKSKLPSTPPPTQRKLNVPYTTGFAITSKQALATADSIIVAFYAKNREFITIMPKIVICGDGVALVEIEFCVPDNDTWRRLAQELWSSLSSKGIRKM